MKNDVVRWSSTPTNERRAEYESTIENGAAGGITNAALKSSGRLLSRQQIQFHTQQQQQQPGAHETSNSTNAQHYPDDSDDDSDDNSHGLLQPQTILNGNQNNHYDGAPSTSTAAATHRSSNSGHSNQQQGMFPANADFLFQLYHQLPHQQQSPTTPQQPTHLNKFQVPQNPAPPRSSEHLLGELVTTELLKMTKERRKTVQKRILEILFFDD
uniref:Uncharacterized protein n=1 Tax=Ceratitis capitata TaxID=7213 RepID=W8C611_CERCA